MLHIELNPTEARNSLRLIKAMIRVARSVADTINRKHWSPAEKAMALADQHMRIEWLELMDSRIRAALLLADERAE